VKGKCPTPTPTPTPCPDGSERVKGKCQPLPGSSTFLSVATKVMNNNAGTKKPSDFTITVTGNSPSPSSFSGSSTGTSVTLRSGSYKVTEDSIPGYTASYSSGCSGAAKGGIPIKCTIINKYVLPGSLTFLDVITNVMNNNAGTKKPSDFTITVTGNSPSPSSFSGSSTGTSVTLRSGSYKVTEDSIPGYTASYSSGCSGVAKGGIPIKCTITNGYQPTPKMAKLMVTKKIINNGIGVKNPSDFTITVTGNNPSPNSFPGSGREGGTTVSLKSGPYKVTETGPSGYISSFSSGCSGRVDADQTTVCIITNEAKKIPPSPKPPIVTTIKGFSGPLGLAYDSTNKDVYVTNYGKNIMAGKVSIIDSSTKILVSTISVGKKPQAIRYNPGNDDIYVANTFSKDVSVINPLRNNVIATIPVGNFPGNSTSGIAYDGANGNTYVANLGSDTVSVIDGHTNTIVDNIKGFFNPAGIAYDSGNGHIYVTNKEANTVSVINPLRNNVIATIPVGIGPSAIAHDAADDEIYVANSGLGHTKGTLSVIDGSKNKVIATIPAGTGPNGIAYDAADDEIYVANTFSNNISVIDSSKNNIISTIRVGINPYGVLYDPANHDIYVANYGSNTISVIHP
jgi:YVTN family beta-propeller protein